ncbi:hypothetical protein GWN42_13605 [candidate division KSB1 bacterium]|nr:hypothetical protein [candidate division KSB1 bacterium]
MNEIIRQWLIEVLGYDDQHIIRAQQEGPIPIGPYATYFILTDVPSNYSLEENEDSSPGDYLQRYYNRGELTVQVDIYASDGRELQHNLAMSRRLLKVRQILQPNNVSLIGSSDIRNLTALVDTKHKARWQCDHSFYLWNTIEEQNEKITNGYEITGKYQPGDEIIEIDVTP